MVWALDKQDSPAVGSPREQVATEVAGIGATVRPGKVRSYALLLNDPIARNDWAWFGGAIFNPMHRLCGQVEVEDRFLCCD
ncbi:hypothetical protein [Bradyrhizobium sp. AZCC 2289]|uniref:hypothetical protein n=1 Tax=Bradyrhizobium sp. AZCC 2289 TaxID=3117026 RepID=UPI002FF04895